MITWISRALALAIHERQLAEHGGGEGIRDEGLLEAALARPQQRHAYGDPPPDLADLAACLAFALARNHPFVDGNKRTAQVCYRVFLLLNDIELTVGDDDKYAQMVGLAAGETGEADFAAWLRAHSRATHGGAVNEPLATYTR